MMYSTNTVSSVLFPFQMKLQREERQSKREEVQSYVKSR